MAPELYQDRKEKRIDECILCKAQTIPIFFDRKPAWKCVSCQSIFVAEYEKTGVPTSGWYNWYVNDLSKIKKINIFEVKPREVKE